MEKRGCLDCGELLRGRADKKFCSDHCRNSYNNRINKENNHYVRSVHSLLRRNRRILSDLYQEGKTRIHKDALFAMGYNFNFFTHVIESSSGTVCRYCYEYGYSEDGRDFYRLHFNSSFLEYS